MGRRNRDTVTPKWKTTPEEQGTWAPCQALQPLNPARERGASPSHWLSLKTNGEYFQESYRVTGNGKASLKGLTCRLAQLAQKHQVEKHMDHRWRGLIYQTWSICQRVKNHLGSSSGTETLVWAIFAISVYLTNINTGGNHLGNLHLSW